MFQNFCSFFGSISLLVTTCAHAQASFQIGPKLGLNAISTSYVDFDPYINQRRSFNTHSRVGLEAGVQVSIGFSNFSLQPALLFSQKGFRVNDISDAPAPNQAHVEFEYDAHFSYLMLPLNLAYTFQSDGQGVQLFAGPYVSWLIGGRFNSRVTRSLNGGSPSTFSYSNDVEGSGPYHMIDVNSIASFQDKTFYSRRVDAGFQAGVGYQMGALLLQASFSQGMQNLGVGIETVNGTQSSREMGPDYKNRAIHLSISYFVIAKNKNYTLSK